MMIPAYHVVCLLRDSGDGARVEELGVREAAKRDVHAEKLAKDLATKRKGHRKERHGKGR